MSNIKSIYLQVFTLMHIFSQSTLMRRLSVSPALLLAAAVTFAPSMMSAQFTTYSSLSSFTAALSSTGTDSFNNLPQQTLTPSPLVRTAGTFGYTVSASTSGFFPVGPSGDAWLSTDEATAIITFNNFLPSVRGIGGFFFSTDFSGVFFPGQTITLTATDANGASTRSLVSATSSTFFGFVSAGTITSLTVTAEHPVDVFAFPTVNDLVLGSGRPSTTVPEPQSLALVAAGLTVVLVGSRRRRAATFVAPIE